MWLGYEDTFKPGTEMYVGGNWRWFPLQDETVGDSCQSDSGKLKANVQLLPYDNAKGTC